MALIRCVLGALSWHFFDEVGTLSVHLEKASASQVAPFVFDVHSLQVTRGKRELWSPYLTQFGVVDDLGEAHKEVIPYAPKLGRIDKVVNRCKEALNASFFSSGEALSLRGELGYPFC